MSPTTAKTRVTPTSLIDEVMDVLARGETALYADLAEVAWQSHATLASLTCSLPTGRNGSDQRDAA